MAFITVDELQVLIEVKAGEFTSNQNRRNVQRCAEMKNAFALLRERQYIVLENDRYVLSGFGEQFIELMCNQNMLHDIWWPHRPIGEYNDAEFQSRFCNRPINDYKNNINIIPTNTDKKLVGLYNNMVDFKSNLNNKPRNHGLDDVDE